MGFYRRVMIMLGVLALAGSSGVAEALVVNININGTTIPQSNCTTTGNPPITTCTIAGAYGNVMVEAPPAGGTPRVEAIDDPNLPALKLRDAKFRAININSVDGSVTISATFSGRNGPRMVRSASGWLARTEAQKAAYSSPTNHGQFVVEGQVASASLPHTPETVDNIIDGGDMPGSKKDVNGIPWAYGNIDSAIFTTNPPELMQSLTGPRDLKVNFTFHLPIINDYLRLSEVKVETLDPGTGQNEPSSLSGYTDIMTEDEDTDESSPCKPCKKCKKCKNE